MANEDFEDLTSVSSSIFYAKKYSISKQKKLLDFSSKIDTKYLSSQTDEQDETIDEIILSDNLAVDSQKELIREKEKKSISYKKQELSDFYPNIIPSDEKKPQNKRKLHKEKKIATSPTKILLKEALDVTREKLKKKSTEKSKKQKKTRKKSQLNRIDSQKSKIISLKEFIPQETIKKHKIIEISKKDKKRTIATINPPFFSDSNPFPFTSLVEWLLWHQNYPELAFVREVYDLDQVPDETDIDIYIVNILNEPEFFSSNWQMVGSKIDNLNAIKFEGRPDTPPEWRITSSVTDGLCTFFEDIYKILMQTSNGIQSYRYPILQFALKGLMLLDLANFDAEKDRWLYKGTEEELITRLRILDQFIIQQKTQEHYRKSLDPILTMNKWYIGIICFDLLAGRSIFIKQFLSQLGLLEEEKINIINDLDLNKKIIQRFKDIEHLDAINVKRLTKKLLI